MQTRNSKLKKKSICIISACILLAVALMFFILQEGEKGHEVPEEPSVEQVSTNEELAFSDEKVNAFEYIIGVMNSPQYWSEDEYFPLYSAAYIEKEARATLLNATAWKLISEKKATFERGYETKLTICFTDHTAVSEDYRTGTKYFLDYKNNEYYVELSGTRKALTLHKDTDGYWNTSFGMLEKTFTDYEMLFSAAGCPLLEMPEGTLTGYKGLRIKPAVRKDDGLIHAVWKEKDFSFNWENKKEISWIDSFLDIEKKKVPDSRTYEAEYEHSDGKIEKLSIGGNSPLYLVLADKESSVKYQGSDLWFEEILVYDNITESLAAYYLAPAMKNLYGYDGVFFTDVRKAKGDSNPFSISSKEEFERGFTLDFEKRNQIILELFPKGDMYVSLAYTYDTQNYDFSMLERKVISLYEYYGKDYPYASDFLGNFLLVYSLEAQSLLGLR